jgi:hypothetical protein
MITADSCDQPEPLAALALDLDDDGLDLAVRIVEVLRAVPGPRSVEQQHDMEIAAWAAVALRRGRRCRDGRRIVLDDLRGLGLDDEVVGLAWVVGGDRRRGEEGARRTALAISLSARLVWTAWWIARVEQARELRKRTTWRTLAARADREAGWVIADMPGAARWWMQKRLDRTRWELPPTAQVSGASWPHR